ncbi:MAG: hypothetical protein JWR20_2332, partial [Marmoricola sp.]|nr:hypothetical protein [Marmoricola sp.]
KQTVNTYPHSAYDDLGQVILGLGIGEAIVTVMNERGAPTPVAWTRLRAPQSLMGAADPAAMEAAVQASPLHAKYAEAVDRESAREILAGKLEAGAAAAQAEQQAAADAKARADADKAAQQQATAEEKLRREAEKAAARGRASSGGRREKSVVEEVVGSTMFKQVARTAAREIVRGMFGTGRRR